MKRVLVTGVCLLSLGRSAPGQSQRAKDQMAFLEARAVNQPQARVSALREFIQQYPDSGFAARANLLALETDVTFFPERTGEIHELAVREVVSAPAGLDRWLEESRTADLLAGAGGKGTDLPDATMWAADALKALTQESFRHQTAASQARYKLPALTERQMQRDFAGYRASFLAAAANVDLRQGKLDEAMPLLEEAYRLRPLSSEVNDLRGQLALMRHRDGEALGDFERADATGALREPWRGEMVRLYVAANSDGEAGLERKVDALYEALYPPVYSLKPRRLPAGGHTVLLELFTGAGCDPCVAPDLAVESLLRTYSRQDLVILEYDENIPRPDPLSNAASEARAIAYRVGMTPEAFLDGESLPVVGATREDAENVVLGFADAVEEQAAQPTGVELRLSVDRDTRGVVTARAEVRSRPDSAKAVVHFALVQDHIRYSGENGIRLHRMVVRALEDGPRETGAAAGNSASVEAVRFDLAQVAARLRAYLDAFETGNDRYGQIRFADKDLPIDPAQLAVAAWVEDPATHEVLESAYEAVPAR